jgi:hypothetical protein
MRGFRAVLLERVDGGDLRVVGERLHDISMTVGVPVFDQVRASGAGLSVRDSQTCRWEIARATDRPSVHPVELLHRAYRLP